MFLGHLDSPFGERIGEGLWQTKSFVILFILLFSFYWVGTDQPASLPGRFFPCFCHLARLFGTRSPSSFLHPPANGSASLRGCPENPF
jgi:hypothetical protein